MIPNDLNPANQSQELSSDVCLSFALYPSISIKNATCIS